MASMILGALLFNALSRPGMLNRASGTRDWVNPAWAPVCLLLSAVAVAAVSLLCLSTVAGETARFYTFLVFEVSNGVYVPSVAYLRGLVVDEKSRAGLYGLMKIPLFIFVILALGITAEGTFWPRNCASCGHCKKRWIKCPTRRITNADEDIEIRYAIQGLHLCIGLVLLSCRRCRHGRRISRDSPARWQGTIVAWGRGACILGPSSRLCFPQSSRRKRPHTERAACCQETRCGLRDGC